MPILGAIIVPHPPLIIPAVGRGEERGIQATIDAYQKAARLVASWQPEVLIVTTPHLVMYSDYFHISPGLAAADNMSHFGALRTVIAGSGGRRHPAAADCHRPEKGGHRPE